jgi:alpha-mannosidase
VTFNEFHDILPGSAINEANKEAIARHAEVLRKSTELRNNAFRKMADEVKFRTGMGQPVVAFNLQPFSRKAIVEATVYSNDKPVSVNISGWGDNLYGRIFNPVEGSLASVHVRDGSGKSYPAQIVYAKVTPPGYTSKVQFIVDDMTAGGYRTFYVDMTSPSEASESIPFINNTFETDFFRVRFDMKTGGIVSLFDKRSNKEYVKEGGQLNQLRIYLEDKNGGMKSWTINKIVREEDITDVKSVKVVENGPVRACIETIKTWGKSRFIERTYIYRSYPRIGYDLEVHWLETGSDSTDSPMLRALFPLAIKNPGFYCQVPFDVVERPIDGKINGKNAPSYEMSQSGIYGVKPDEYDGQEVPAQKWVDVTDGQTGIALLNNSKYGHSYHNGDLRITLMRAAGNPDIYPNLGKFNISYALYPHAGDWENGCWTEGDDFNVPVYAAEPPSLALVNNHSTRPEEESFFFVDQKNVILSGLKKAEVGEELILRLCEIEGKETLTKVTLPLVVNSVRRLNLVELPLDIDLTNDNAAIPEIEGKSVIIKLRPHEIVTLGIK